MKAQASAEFLIAIAIMAIALVPILGAMQWDAQTSPEKLALGKASFSADRLSSAVDSVGSMGPGAAVVVQIEMPQINKITAVGREITINLDTSYGPVEIVKPARFNITSKGFERIGREGKYAIDVRAGANPDDAQVMLELR